MTAEHMTVSVRLDDASERRIRKAADLLNQSQSDFLKSAGDHLARRIVLDWAVAQYQQGGWSFGELADETGLAIEEIMQSMSAPGTEGMFGAASAGRDAGDDAAVEPEVSRFVERAMSALREDA
jgi:predicted transcriptional regulator